MINPDLMRQMDDFELSARVANCLKIDEIEYVWQLVQHTKAELLRTPNFGRKGLSELEKQILEPLGLAFSEAYVDRKLPPTHMDDGRFIAEDVT